MFKRLMILMIASALAAATASAQTKTPQASKTTEKKSEAATPKPPPEPAPLPVNIKIEVSITDQTGDSTPARKVVTMIAGDRQNTSIRSSASVPVRQAVAPGAAPMYNYRNVTINVDARPAILPKERDRVMVSFGLEYFPKTAGGREEAEPGMASFNERLGLILDSGKPMLVSQAADPTSDRKITVEVTATILK